LGIQYVQNAKIPHEIDRKGLISRFPRISVAKSFFSGIPRIHGSTHIIVHKLSNLVARLVGQRALVAAGSTGRLDKFRKLSCTRLYFSGAMRHAGSVRHRPITPPVGRNKEAKATERSTEPRIREREEVCERTHTCPDIAEAFPVLMLPPFAFSIRVFAPQDRQAREKVDDWMARASSVPGSDKRTECPQSGVSSLATLLVSCLPDSARCPLHCKSWQATDNLELVCIRKHHLSRLR
jgi:hypothetical protein